MLDKIFYLIFFIIILAMSRIIPHPPNFTPILASAIMAPILIKDRMFGIAIPIFAMFLSDIVIGFHSYQFVVYFSILIISLITPITKNYLSLFIIAIISSIWFFIVTNFAVWIIWDYYPKNIEGLISCYTLAIPFFKNTLISTSIFTCLIAFLMNHIEIINKKTVNLISKIIQ
tara:strand:+ start:852 stop:1370 length:519 start_codon:yes stop_codon:yes gene_type:complete